MAREWRVEASDSAMNSRNLIREAVANILIPEDFPRQKYSLALGDPSCFPEFATHQGIVEAVAHELTSGGSNGYIAASGPDESKTALAKYYSNANFELTKNDVIMDVGCSGAIATVINCLANPGDNILIPTPGFPLYVIVSQNRGIETRSYRLQPDHLWEADISHLESLIDDRTKLLVIVNPSNPCGSVYSREHLLQLLEVASRHRIPVLADEVYGKMSFSVPFVSLGELTTEVPVFLVGGLAKRWLVPGWRVGWIVIYDKLDLVKGIRDAIGKVKNIMLHPVTFLAKAVPRILEAVPEEFFTEILQKLKRNADYLYSRVQRVPGLTMSMPQGAMYCMINVDLERLRDMTSSREFAEKLAREQGVVVLPGECFLSTSSFRIVLCNPQEVLGECFDRIEAFLQAHAK